MANSINVARWESYLEHKTGVHLSARSAHVSGVIERRMIELKLSTEDDYWRTLHRGDEQLERALLVDELVLKDTRFFRHSESFDFVRELVQQRLANGELGSLFSAWSVGCSSGEEVWSLAMVLSDCFDLNKDHNGYFSVLGSDVSYSAIASARRGIYSVQQLKNMPQYAQQAYFTNSGKSVEVIQSVRDRVAFEVSNVLDLGPAVIKHDLIFCQNLLVYFRKWRRRQILDKLVEHLAVGGMLIIGPGEMTSWDHPMLKKVDKPNVTAYQKITE